MSKANNNSSEVDSNKLIVIIRYMLVTLKQDCDGAIDEELSKELLEVFVEEHAKKIQKYIYLIDEQLK